jgi:uncharacterized membrane protein
MSLSIPPLRTRPRLGPLDAVGVAPVGRAVDGGGHRGDDASGDERLVLLERCAWSLVWLGALVGGCALWGSWWSWPVADVLAPALVAASLAGLCVCWCSASPRAAWHQGAAMAAGLVAVVLPQAIDIHNRRYYASDSAALDHVAARVLVSGHDPYTSSLAAAALFFKTPTDFWTYLVTGGHVMAVSYPAGSFLVYAPALALGFHHAVVDWVDLFAWLAGAVILFLLLPRYLRWLGALVAMTGFFLGLFTNGGTDAAFIPFAMIAVWRWDRYGQGKAAGVARWIGPVALGLACSIKQTPWFCVPFLVAGIAIEARRSGRDPMRVVARYLGTVAVVFGAVNLPFIAWGASAWWHGTMTPITEPLVADGQGVVSLALHGLTGGVDLRLLMDASALALVAVVVAFCAWYEALKRIWLLLLPVAFFFSPRSFSSYLVDLFPVALVAIVTTAPAVASAGRRRVGRLPVVRAAAVGLAGATGVLAALSFTGAPLALTYRAASTGPAGLHLYSVTVAVTNRTGAALEPRFMVDVGADHPTGFWTTAHHRPVVLGPHATATVTLYPPAPTFLPQSASDYVVDAYTAAPQALSTTADIWRNAAPAHLRR